MQEKRPYEPVGPGRYFRVGGLEISGATALRVARLLCLIPPVTLLLDWMLFGTSPSTLSWAGGILSLLGAFLANRVLIGGTAGRLSRISRRSFLRGLGICIAVPFFSKSSDAGIVRPPGEGAGTRSITLLVNGARRRLEVEPRQTLAEILRNKLGLMGTKIVCDRASCGACTVLMGDLPVYSCHLLAVQVDGMSIQTIEGVAQSDSLHPLQQAFIDQDATQCGFCTPGMILSLKSALDKQSLKTAEDVKRCIAGNICRCAAYNHIITAALKAAGGS